MAKTNPSPTFPMYPGDAAEVTKSDSTVFSPSVIYVGGTGNVKVTTSQGTVVTFSGVPAGAVLPVQAIKVWSTDTTATLMVRIF
jgi:hypothetical protein